MANVCMQCRGDLPPASNQCPSCGFVNPVVQKSGGATAIIVIVVIFAILVPVIGVFAAVGVYGVRKYIVNAKTAEARNALGQIAKDAVTVYEATHRICPSAPAPVPLDASHVSGRKYQSLASEWDANGDRGFTCLHFAMTSPQYFQYSYEATARTFTATARGDLDGDGKFSTYKMMGQIVGDQLVIAPQLLETNPGE